VIAILLAFLWVWTGIAYHLAFFAAINPAAVPFAVLCLVEAAVLLVCGGILGRIEFRGPSGDWRWITGAALIAYGLVVYPLLGMVLGHTYPASPTFGLPCPTTIFTIGLLFMAFPTARWYLLVIPLAWSFVGGSAAFKLGIREDMGLLVSGVLLVVLIINGTARRAVSTATTVQGRVPEICWSSVRCSPEANSVTARNSAGLCEFVKESG
jgi:hypothetical protein